VAFGEVVIKEHGVKLLFEEWNPIEEGLQLQRVWIRIYRLPEKLREFSVLWALGSMLGATQSVDIIRSLRNDYGRVEVAVLNVDLLPNSIDSVVIGDRLYSLPIMVEGREDEVDEENHMEVDNGNSGDNSSAKKKQSDNGSGNSSEGKEKQKEKESDGPSHNAKSQDEKQSEQLDTVEHGGVDPPTAMQNKVLNFLSDTRCMLVIVVYI
jgi:hypothetical protein